MPTRRWGAANTHLYAGARLHPLDPADGTEPAAGDLVLIEFSDGQLAQATLERPGAGALVLAVASHQTARGTAIAPRRWRLVPGGTAGEFKVRSRLS